MPNDISGSDRQSWKNVVRNMSGDAQRAIDKAILSATPDQAGELSRRLQDTVDLYILKQEALDRQTGGPIMGIGVYTGRGQRDADARLEAEFGQAMIATAKRSVGSVGY